MPGSNDDGLGGSNHGAVLLPLLVVVVAGNHRRCVLLLGDGRGLGKIEDAGRGIGRGGEGGVEAGRRPAAHGRLGGGPDQEAALLLHGVRQTVRVEAEVDPDQDLLPLGAGGGGRERSGDGAGGAQDDAHGLGVRSDQDGEDGLEGEGRRSLVQTATAVAVAAAVVVVGVLEGHLSDLDPLLGLDEFPVGRLLDAEGRLDVDDGQIGDGPGQVVDGRGLGVVVAVAFLLVKRRWLVGDISFSLLLLSILLLGHEGLLDPQDLGEGADPRAVPPLQGDAEGLEDVPGHDVGGLRHALAAVGAEGPAEEVGSTDVVVLGGGGDVGGEDEPAGGGRHGPLGPLMVGIDGQGRTTESEGRRVSVRRGAC